MEAFICASRPRAPSGQARREVGPAGSGHEDPRRAYYHPSGRSSTRVAEYHPSASRQGCASAYYLKQRGFEDVTIVERTKIAAVEAPSDDLFDAGEKLLKALC